MIVVEPTKHYEAPIEAITTQPTTGFNTAKHYTGPASFLSELTEIVIEQKTDKEMAPANIDMATEHTVMNSKREPIMNTIEDTDFCIRALCGSLRPIVITFLDFEDTELFLAKRKSSCCKFGCCCNCCGEEMRIEMSGATVGYIKYERSWLKPKYRIYDDRRSPMFTIVGRRAPSLRSCCRPLKILFPIMAGNGTTKVGEILKKRLHLLPEMTRIRPYLVITFPKDASIQQKAVLIAAALYIDVHYWDRDPVTFLK